MQLSVLLHTCQNAGPASPNQSLKNKNQFVKIQIFTLLFLLKAKTSV